VCLYCEYMISQYQMLDWIGYVNLNIDSRLANLKPILFLRIGVVNLLYRFIDHMLSRFIDHMLYGFIDHMLYGFIDHML
jgi:hypothetical protein